MSDPDYEQVLQFVREHSRPFVKSVEVSEEFPEVSRRTINERLNTLHDRDKIQKRKIGANGAVWYTED